VTYKFIFVPDLRRYGVPCHQNTFYLGHQRQFVSFFPVLNFVAADKECIELDAFV
jgi:hypothetical protein